jgi:hypothetical protein
MKDPDTYWHVMTGRWIIAHGDVPRVDVFSHTAAGTPWIDGEWLSQVVMAVTYDHAGWLGLQALLIACVVATYAIICTFLMHVYPRWVSAVVSVGAIYFRPVSLAGHAPSCPRHAAAGVVDRAALPIAGKHMAAMCAYGSVG